MKYLSPYLPEILTPSLGEDYSASLVRQGQSESSSVVVIRIQSPKELSEEAQCLITKEVEQHFNQNSRGLIPLHLSRGELILLSERE